MESLKVGDQLPTGVTFSYVPYAEENKEVTSCGIPVNYDASKGKLPNNLFPSNLHPRGGFAVI